MRKSHSNYERVLFYYSTPKLSTLLPFNFKTAMGNRRFWDLAEDYHDSKVDPRLSCKEGAGEAEGKGLRKTGSQVFFLQDQFGPGSQTEGKFEVRFWESEVNSVVTML